MQVKKKCLPLQSQSKERVVLQNSNGAIAQLVEQRTENPCVPGSIPGGTTKNLNRSNSVEVFSCLYPSLNFVYGNIANDLVMTSLGLLLNRSGPSDSDYSIKMMILVQFDLESSKSRPSCQRSLTAKSDAQSMKLVREQPGEVADADYEADQP